MHYSISAWRHCLRCKLLCVCQLSVNSCTKSLYCTIHMWAPHCGVLRNFSGKHGALSSACIAAGVWPRAKVDRGYTLKYYVAKSGLMYLVVPDPNGCTHTYAKLLSSPGQCPRHVTASFRWPRSSCGATCFLASRNGSSSKTCFIYSRSSF
ncbi:hypothetical protein PR003_g14151 [Phytophthora rubi]|uniref:Secreted protein n=1 Tax=Phytophthora rubi TaxID=129364 RepID=A0A6A3LJN8_9STRA|nr:hypothetical protein PR002_g13681 [Phytophthora rubi]KAE9022514.1 hypothetical protein PR001_g13132 [Phytophthora rubi]KAE9333176.1 hypothetical protein PR003_g14151 [Phytophthora rubi]